MIYQSSQQCWILASLYFCSLPNPIGQSVCSGYFASPAKVLLLFSHPHHPFPSFLFCSTLHSYRLWFPQCSELPLLTLSCLYDISPGKYPSFLFLKKLIAVDAAQLKSSSGTKLLSLEQCFLMPKNILYLKKILLQTCTQTFLLFSLQVCSSLMVM